MKNQKEKCTELARITLPWGGHLLNYCPVHANQIAMLAKAMGAPVKAQLIPQGSTMECEQTTPLTEEEKELAKTFKL